MRIVQIAAAAALAARRALVIVIDAYPSLPAAAQLERAVADAEAVGTPSGLGFQVTRLTAPAQVTLRGLARGFDDFKKTVARDEMVLVFSPGTA